MSDIEQDWGDRLAVENDQFVTITIADQLFGIPVLTVHDVLVAQKITPIPLAPPEVAGALNLRGRIVTAIDVRRALGLAPREGDDPGMYVVVEHDEELYSLMVDTVGEVMDLPSDAFERPPTTLEPRWREVASGIYRLEGQLLLVLDVERLLDFDKANVT
ncbi:MAG: chemotaxis protein CheW [Alphaproteobacteria bacterium]|jgi:purine-binding chemotaxis protein CheW|nr:chemotaxis protein CheW [Alphaproteobacteria bacterium]